MLFINIKQFQLISYFMLLVIFFLKKDNKLAFHFQIFQIINFKKKCIKNLLNSRKENIVN